MIAPVTVIGSVVVCLFFVALGCANANGAISEQARVTIVLFIMPPFLMSKLPELLGLEQEPLRAFPTVQFYLGGGSAILRSPRLSGKV